MSSNGEVPAWRSTREVVPTAAVAEQIERLAAIDASFDALPPTQHSHGEEVSRPRARRIARAISVRLRRWLPWLGRLALLLTQPAGARLRLLSQRTASRRLPDTVQLRDGVAAVVAFSSITDLTERLDAVSSEFVLLCRSPLDPGPRALRAFAAQVDPSAADFVYADSVSPTGARVFRPPPSRLLTEQADWFGAVIAVRSELARAALARSSDPRVFRTIALEVPEHRCAHVDVVVGVAPFRNGETEPRQAALTPADSPLVSIIIPTRGTSGTVGGEERVFVLEAVRSILARTRYPNFELVVVADDPTPQDVIDELDRLAGQRLRLVRWAQPFNFSEKMNLGASVASGEYLLMLNDDVEVAADEWLNELVELVRRPEFNVAGALLFFEDASLQHAGHLYRGGAGHIGFGKPLRERDPNDYLPLDREVSGVTGACLLISAADFASVGGFSPRFPGNYNDVDLCLKLQSRGGRAVCSGRARLYHFESKSRDATVRPEDLERINARWRLDRSVDRFAPAG